MYSAINQVKKENSLIISLYERPIKIHNVQAKLMLKACVDFFIQISPSSFSLNNVIYVCFFFPSMIYIISYFLQGLLQNIYIRMMQCSTTYSLNLILSILLTCILIACQRVHHSFTMCISHQWEHKITIYLEKVSI